MPKLDIKNTAGETVGDIDLDDAIFAEEVHEHLFWEVVKWQRARRRAGTHSTKRRGEVRGSNIKPYRQKGTGRARQGDRKAPHWVGGGSVFGPKPRSYDYALPKKVRKKALRSALSLRAKEQKLVVLDAFPVEGGKTRNVVSALAALGAAHTDNRVLIVDAGDNLDLIRGTRNLRGSKWLAPEGLNVYDILDHSTLVMTSATVKAVERALQPNANR
ncbi:50S ribosomal protein L4 [Haliangium ochraceum]|uniref:Large ribosomal subunit protein uL4 n=1 Tax=Haliangium ochraceum (strain DSM 14365 / JCM 11303 / SMP-2) TaxID=502025 RepID=D0LIC4_HALO1|nr:50S ribosomal protein L4 [Haliangium ochraceum]ACY16503.1 ribosomal protein L4/L1e [Haliangium ochraceum DSM 14365]